MSRYTDALSPAAALALRAIDPAPTKLPAIDWALVGMAAPQPVATPPRVASDPLPTADVVVITWTNAEWSALDHVFANSGTPRGATPPLGAWSAGWNPYTHNVGAYSSGETSEPLWGSFRQVTVAAESGLLNVLLFHSNAHLQYKPYIDGLRAMVSAIIGDARPKQLYSIGTAGGATLGQALGDAVVTNAAQLEAGKAPNEADPANGQTFACTGWYPPTGLFVAAQSLMFSLAQVATPADLQVLFEHLLANDKTGLALSDLLNAPLENLGPPAIHNMPNVPLNTSCNYAMAPAAGSTQYSAYEEDDAAVGQAAKALGVDFAFIRNVSDTVVPGMTASGKVISATVRKAWAGLLYDRYGWLTASNGALAAWAAIAGG